ncbi:MULTISPECIES: LacI family DNA-binding transcriptional regulator [Streptomyces]|uniref:LacI family transcriptional regulator n=1 Tax=Streptomyces lycii TaxID=2654337 RepID=A0ABQ7FJG0_9ACTN|nr:MULTISPECIES: LacI family DNA-binding transcriptional regulator [Streptomyces]KAF4408509.1 LacI family transcriptional regulator [Streptomyces lycii]PGH49055.1 LacI family transcriptional regulator [Streptomyces sp. Ru87]
MAEDGPRRQPTLDEVAGLAGVSRSVASRALNNAPHVSRAKREAVERAVRQLGYVPNPTARALATRQTGAAALVVSGEDPSIFADPFFAQVIVGASAALEEADLHLMLCLAASDRGRKRVEELFRSKGADGVMLMALREGDPLTRTAEEAAMPVVFGGRPVGPAPRWYVDVDNAGGAREAVEYLVSLGRTRVAALCGRLDTEAGRARYRGYRDAVLAAGLDPFPPQEGDFTESSGAAAMAALLAEHPDVDGVFAANDNMGVGALRTLGGAGRRVPDDVAVVGFDDLALARTSDPPLTTVHQPIQALGREMARMVAALVNGQDRTPLILPTRLVVRASA